MLTAAVVGGRGKTGRAVIAALDAAGASARTLGRAELHDPVAAFDSCDAAYLIAPNMHADEPALIGELLAAARTAGVPRVVYHSVAAPYAPDMPHHLGKAEAEHLVRTSGLAWAILQPCAYTQNFLPQLSMPTPALTVPYHPESEFGFVDLADVAEVAARGLLDPGLTGSTLELGGPELLTVSDVARAASHVLGSEVPVQRISTREWAAGGGAALSDRERSWLIAMFGYYDAHGFACGPVATRAVLGREPTDVSRALTRELNPDGWIGAVD